jgi:hypothetical protein
MWPNGSIGDGDGRLLLAASSCQLRQRRRLDRSGSPPERTYWIADRQRFALYCAQYALDGMRD